MSTQQNIRQLLESFASSGPAGCGLSIHRDGREIFRYCTGYADLESKRAMKANDIVRLFSNTKVFTNVAVLTLFEQGKILLNDPIALYLPEFSQPVVGQFTYNGTYTTRPAAGPIRIKHLMSMTSGLTYGTEIAGGENSQTNMHIQRAVDALEAQGGYTVREFSKAIAEVPLLFDPGSSWHYGYSHDILGALIEVVADMSFEEYLQQVICGPLGLADTSFFLPEAKRPRLARQYTDPDAQGQRVLSEHLDNSYDPAHKMMAGGSGLLSTLEDFSRFAAMLAGGGTLDGARILASGTVDLMRENHLGPVALEAFRAAHSNGWEFATGYGYGLGVRTMLDRAEAGSNGSLGEFGWSGAAGTWMMADPACGLSAAYVQQVLPNPYESAYHPRLRAVVYAYEG